MDSAAIIQEKWRTGLGLHVEGIVFGDGRVILLRCRKLMEGKHIVLKVSPVGDSSLESVTRYEEDAWVEVAEHHRQEIQERNLVLTCGEGAMGNEGYLAASDLDTGRLRWFAFFTCSNPFTMANLVGGTLVAEDSLERTWTLSLDEPWKIHVG